MPGDDATKAFFEGPGHTVTYIDGDETEGSWQYDIALENGNCISVAEVHLFLLDSGRRASVQELTSGPKLVSL